MRALQSGLHVDEALALQTEGRFDEAEESIKQAWQSAIESGDPERVIVAAKLVLGGANPLDNEQNTMMFEVSKLAAHAAQQASLPQEEAFMLGTNAIVAAHRFVARLTHAKLQQKIVEKAGPMDKWFADYGVVEGANALGVAMDQVFKGIDQLHSAGSYVMMSELLRQVGIAEGIIADFGAVLDDTDPEPLRELSVRHLKVSLTVARALDDDELIVQGLLDLAVQVARLKDGKTESDALLSEVAKIISEMKRPKAHEGRLARVRNVIANPPKRPNRSYDDLTEQEKDEFARIFARQGGYNIDEPKTDLDHVIAIGIRDRNPERILRWCEHLEVATTSTGVPGRLMGLPTAGSKVLYCDAKPYALEGLQLDGLMKAYQEGPCVGCPMRKPRTTDWNWSEKWAKEQGLSPKFKDFLRQSRQARGMPTPDATESDASRE